MISKSWFDSKNPPPTYVIAIFNSPNVSFSWMNELFYLLPNIGYNIRRFTQKPCLVYTKDTINNNNYNNSSINSIMVIVEIY